MALKPNRHITGLTIAVLTAMAFFSFARAHDEAEWINAGRYKNAAGELCCGQRDCFELANGDVSVTASGYFVHSIKETVPFTEALPSPDGRYWRCQWGGMRKCFFAPPPSI
jgi:hypothetical protein